MNKALFAQMVDWETQGMVRSEARKGQRPRKASREKVIKEFMAQREETSKLSPDQPRFFFPRGYHPCIRSLSELKTMLNDLIGKLTTGAGTSCCGRLPRRTGITVLHCRR